MYESFYNFTARPFPSTPVVERYFAAEAIESARQTIMRNIERAAGPSLLVGPAGTGKSQLCHVLASELQDAYQIVMLSSARLCTRRALLKNILFELELPYHDREEGELRLALIDHLKHSNARANGAVMLVDEAHALPLRLLEELRMITNLVHDGRPCVHLVLAGSHRLENRFADPRLESFSQRLAARCYLQALNSEECRGYVCSELGHVGGNADALFSADALQAIYQATGGVPRLINQVCDHALILGSLGGHSSIDARGIDEAWADLQQLPAPWNEDEQGSAAKSAIIEFGPLVDEAEAGDEEPVIAGQVHEGLPAEEVTQPEDVLENLTQLEGQIRDMDQPAKSTTEQNDSFVPKANDHEPEIQLVIHPAHDPFGETFDEEETVIDRYASLDADVRHDRPVVSCDESQQIYAALHSEITTDSGTNDATDDVELEEPQMPPVDIVAASTVIENTVHGEPAPYDGPLPEVTAYTTTDLPLESPGDKSLEHEDSHLLNELPDLSSLVNDELPTGQPDGTPALESEHFDPALDPVYPEPLSPSAPAVNADVTSPTQIAEVTEPVAEPASTPAPPETLPSGIARDDDRDIIMIDEGEAQGSEQLDGPSVTNKPGYGQLFARLRRG